MIIAWKRGFPRSKFLYENLSTSPMLPSPKSWKDFFAAPESLKFLKLLRVLGDRVVFTVLSDRSLSRILSDKVFFRIHSNTVFLRVLNDSVLLSFFSDRVLFKVPSDTVIFRVLSDRLFFRVLIDSFISWIFSPLFPICRYFLSKKRVTFFIKNRHSVCGVFSKKPLHLTISLRCFNDFNKTNSEKHEEILVW